MRKRMQAKAFTLVEIIVSSLIIVTIAGAAFATVIFSQSLVGKERSRLVALEYINAILEDYVFDADFDDAALSIGSHTMPSSLFPATDSFWQAASPSVTYNVSWYKIDPNIPVNPADPATLVAKQIDITVNWREKAGQGIENRSVTLSSIKIR